MIFVKFALYLLGCSTIEKKDMNNKTRTSIKWLSVAILFLATVSVLSIYWQMVSQLWLNPAEERVVWNQNGLAWQIFIIAGHFIGVTLLYVFCWIFLIRTNRSLRSGEIFPRSNVSLIRWTALVTVLQGDMTTALDSNTIFFPLIVLLFAGLYKMAYLAAKDSNLAI